VVHLDLKAPPVVTAQEKLWEAGGRGPVDPREAAGLLWSVPVAAYLDGRADAWLDVPGVRSLLPGLTELASKDQATWPGSEAELRTLVAKAAPDSPDWAELAKELTKAGTLDLLNDLVLIFKYAAINENRPVQAVAELYRLARTLLTMSGGPSTREQVIASLTAPLVSPRVLTAPSGPPAPKPPAPKPTPPHPGPWVGPRVDLTSVGAVRALDRLGDELTRVEEARRRALLNNSLRDAGVSDPSLLRRIVTETLGTASSAFPPTGTSVSVQPADQPLARVSLPPASPSRRPHVIRGYLYGTPIMLDVGAVQARTARARHQMALWILQSLPEALRTRLGVLGVAIEDLQIWPDLVKAMAHGPSYLEPIGRSDLLLVRQTTTGYRRAEIAYIENVLIGESRDREHTNRVLTRQEFFERVERETEETRDLQVADKAELSREVSKVVSEDLQAQGSVQVTSRGPTTIVAAAGVSYDRSTEEAAKAAESYSRETIERAVKRTLERVTRETRSLFEQETTEVNRHGFQREPTAADHVSGVYQYLERVSHAKIFWYGERELYDLLIPEPAALIWQFAISRNELHIPIEAPDADLFASLALANIASKREDVIRAFRVTDMPPALEESRETSMSFSGTGGGDSAKYASGKELQIPDGYVATGATFVVSAEVEDEDDIPNGGVTVAGQVQLWEMTLSGNKGSARREFTFPNPLPGPALSVAVNADNFTSLAGSVTVRLGLTNAAREAWALAAYGRVAERYEQLRREYAQAVIQATANQPAETVSLPDGSRLKLQQVVRAELQRAAIDIMRNAPVDFDLIEDYPYAQADGTLGVQPSVGLGALHAAEPEVRFLQQAFEWEHLAWILYPYFWGRRSEWSRTVAVSHPEPDFGAFLNAGAARLQVPVRPGFEDLVKHFMETGEVYEGGGLPKMGDPGYVSFIDEQLTSLGAPGDEVAWPPGAPREWDIVAPTSLLLARSLKLAQLPSWDPDTGDEL
jgi:hypothetical protein